MRTEDYFPELNNKIEKSIIAALSSSKDNRMFYKDLKGHKSTSIKRAVLSLEKEGYIRFIPIKQTNPTRTNESFLQYLVGIELLNPKVSNQDAEEFIKKFNKTTDDKTKLQLLYELIGKLNEKRYHSNYMNISAMPSNTSNFSKKLKDIIQEYANPDEEIHGKLGNLIDRIIEAIRIYDEDLRYIPTRSKKLVEFIVKTIIESNDPDIIRECVIILDFLFTSDKKAGISFVENSISKDVKKEIIKKLIKKIKEDPYNYIQSLFELLSYLDPKAAIKALFDAFKQNSSERLILNGWTYPDLIKDAYDKLDNDKEWVIDRCNELITSIYDEKKKEELRLILRKL